MSQQQFLFGGQDATEGKNFDRHSLRMNYLRAWRRRFGFQCGLTFVAVKECVSRENAKPDLSFIVTLTTEQTIEEIERLIRTEVLKRVGLLR